MSRFSGKAAVFGVAAAAFATASQREACAQNPASQSYRLSSAVEAIKRTPFHVPFRAGDSGAAQRPQGLSAAPSPAGERWVSLEETGTEDATTDPVSAVVILLATATSAALADVVAAYLLFSAAYVPTDRWGWRERARLAAAPAVGVLGPALGATIAGGDFRNALAGSLAGLGLGLGTAIIIGESGGPIGPVLGVTAHAGMTALLACR